MEIAPQPTTHKGFKSAGEVIAAVAILVIIVVGYGFLAKANHWWPHDGKQTSLGTLTGRISYPADALPEEKVCAVSISDSGKEICTTTNSFDFRLDVPVGTYYVYAMMTEEAADQFASGLRGYKAYYTEYADCVLKDDDSQCDAKNHTKVKVIVTKDSVQEVSPTDWYDGSLLISPSPAVPSSDRILIPRNQIDAFKSKLPDPCDFEAINALHFYSQENDEYSIAINPVTEHVAYQSSKWGLEVALPYNPIWGSPTYRLNPYDEYDKQVAFGSINFRAEGCGGWLPTLSIHFQAAESKAKLLARLRAESAKADYPYEINESVIAGKDVVEYSAEGICAGGETIVIGKKYNYSFQSFCSGYTDEAMISSMKFIE